MKSIASATMAVIEQDPIAYEALGRGVLNAHAYARSIHGKIEAWCKKEVKVNTIVTAIRRLGDTLPGHETLIPNFSMGAITVKMGLMELAFTKGESAARVAKWLNKQGRNADEFFLTIEGNREVDFIFPARFMSALEKQVDITKFLNGTICDLSAVTLSYASELTFVPNVCYAIMRGLALRHINVVEVISSYSEVTFIFSSTDVDRALEVCKTFLHPR